MYNTEITVNDKNIPIKFGAYVIKRLTDDGYKLSNLDKDLADNPFDIIPKIFYYGAVNASENREGKGITINDIYDWLDEQRGGLMGKVSVDILNLFILQMTDGVPVPEEVQDTKKK